MSNQGNSTTASAVSTASSNEADPVLAAVQAYRVGTKAFEAIPSWDHHKHGGEEAVIEKTYGPPMRVLNDWDTPCKTREGAIAALQHALEEGDAFSCSDSLTSMTRAALNFLEDQEKELPVDRVERLARELSDALSHWANGQFMAMVFPAGDIRGFWFRTVSRDERGDEADPIISVINQYYAGIVAFRAIPEEVWPDLGGENAVCQSTYGAAMDALDNWRQPCTSREGAISAMRFAQKESEDYYAEPSVKSMIAAVLAYLEGAAA